MKKRHIAIGTGLLLVALGASAVSLGRVRGVPLIGRGLDVSVPATLAAGDAANLCAQAEVYYADNRVDGNRVQVTVEPGPTADEPTIRIRSSAAVDEPVVTVYLRAGCAGALSRRYVLFAEFVPDAPASGATLAAVSGSAAPAALTPIAAIVAGAATGPDPLPPAAASAVVASAVSLQASPAAVAVPPAPAAPAAASTPAARPAARAEPKAAAPAAAAPAPSAVAKPPAAATAPSAAPATAPAAKPASKAAAPAAPAKPAPAPAADQAPLKLEATAPSVDRSAQLRTATAVTLSPEAPDRRAAAAAQWKTLAMDSEQAQREAQRVQALEAEAKAQKQALQKLEASMADVKSQLQRAEDERYLNPFTYVLMALVLGGIGAAAYLWNKLRTMSARREWWDVEDAEGDLPVADVGDTMAPASSPAQAQVAPPATRVMAPAVASVGAAPAASRTQLAPAAAPKAAPVAAPAARAVAPKPMPAATQGDATSAALQHLQGGVPIRRLNADVVNEVFRLSEPGALDELEDGDKPPAPPPQDQPPFLNSLSTTSVRSVSAEELMDIQRQADFFVSLGQHDQAIDVLRTHIQDNPDTSPLAYLDLLSIHHGLGQRAEYQSLREEVTGKFSVEVPEFDRFGEPSDGLEKYGRALSRIQALWPGPRVLQLLEESIFRPAGAEAADAFDLDAYRELLMLYSLAKDLSRDAADGDQWGARAAAGSREDLAMTATIVQPLPAAMSTQFRGGAPAAAGGADIDLDLGFDDPAPAAAPAAAPAQAAPAPSPAPAAAPAEQDMSLNFDLGDLNAGAAPAAPAPAPAAKAPADDMSLDFDLPPIDPDGKSDKKA